jgi:branched-chain amino acid transport system ATP-binding protein
MLNFENVHAVYGNVEALFGVSLDVNEGELVSIIGGNGAGKSTTLQTILGMVRMTSGRIQFQGSRIDGLRPRKIVQQGIALCPEDRRLWPEMTVRENVLLGALLRSDKAEIHSDLNRMYSFFPILGERQEQLAGNLSGGEQQMAAIARALMARPKLLMLDEPSLGLSPIFTEKVAQIIGEIHQAGTTILLVEQNAFLALHMSDRTYVLEVGQVATSGSSSSLLKNDYIKEAYLGRKQATKTSSDYSQDESGG